MRPTLILAAATNVMRVTTADTSITAPHLTAAAHSDTIFIEKGTLIILDSVGFSYNARNYTDPYAYNPRRWESATKSASSNHEASLDNFLAFSAGPRVCLGKKFSTVEATCFLSNILRGWKFDVKLEKGESMREWQERVMRPEVGITLRIGASSAIVISRIRH